MDIKSFLIGILFTSTVIFGVAATSKSDAGVWDPKQEWEFRRMAREIGFTNKTVEEGWEPVAIYLQDPDYVWARRRVK